MRRSIYVFMMALFTVSFLVGCGGNNPAGPSGPGDAAPGFEIWNLREKEIMVSGDIYYVQPLVNYKGDQGGIEGMHIKGGDGVCKDWKDRFGIIEKSGVYYGWYCDITKNGTYTFEAYLQDNSSRYSNVASMTVTVTQLSH